MKKGFAVLITMILGFSFLQPVSAAEKAAEQLKKEVVTSGDGLYADPTVPGRYVFKGANPNNYITIGDDVYRIISVESDGSLKVMSTVSLERDFDSLWSRSSSDSNDYCYNTGASGCNVWGSKTTVFDTDGKHVTQMSQEVNGPKYDLPDEEASLNTYLNDEWYESLDDNVKSLIVAHDFNVGPISDTQTSLAESVKEESAYKWNGKVGLIGVTDYVKASTNSACDSVPEYLSSACMGNPNYLSSDLQYFLITPDSFMESYVGSISNRNIFVQSSNNILSNHTSGYGSLVYPTFYIKPNITLSGAGLKSDTYVIYEYVDSENDSTSTPDTNTPSQVVEVPSTSAYVSLIISVAGIVLVVLAIGVIYFTSKKKKTKKN